MIAGLCSARGDRQHMSWQRKFPLVPVGASANPQEKIHAMADPHRD